MIESPAFHRQQQKTGNRKREQSEEKDKGWKGKHNRNGVRSLSKTTV
jgi:hypothetical protein